MTDLSGGGDKKKRGANGEEEEKTPRKRRKSIVLEPIKDWSAVTDTKALQKEVLRLQQVLHSARKQLQEATSKNTSSATTSKEITHQVKETERLAAKARKSVLNQIGLQMNYRPTMKSSKPKLNAEVPNFTEEAYKSLIGPELASTTKGNKKNYKLDITEDLMRTIFGSCPSKTLRYGAVLTPNYPLTMLYSRDEQSLVVKGSYVMSK